VATPEKRKKTEIDLQRCQNGQECVVILLLLILPRHTFFPRDFSETVEDTGIINTPLEPLRPADVPFKGFLDIAPHFGGEIAEIPPKPQFLGRK